MQVKALSTTVYSKDIAVFFYLSVCMVFFHWVVIYFGYLNFKKKMSESLQIASTIPIPNQSYNSHTEPIFKSMGFVKIQDML